MRSIQAECVDGRMVWPRWALRNVLQNVRRVIYAVADAVLRSTQLCHLNCILRIASAKIYE